MSRDENFLSRWSRRKHDSRQAEPEGGAAHAGDDAAPVAPQPAAPAPTEAARKRSADEPVRGEAAPSASSSPGEPAAGGGKRDRERDHDRDRPIELPSIESLTPQSDFRPFMQAGVDAATRSAALRKLFADPHFNVMDGLDVYIDDYNKTEPIPPAMLAKLRQLHAIGLSDEEIERWSGEDDDGAKLALAHEPRPGNGAAPADQAPPDDDAPRDEEPRPVDEPRRFDADAQRAGEAMQPPDRSIEPSGASPAPDPNPQEPER